MKRQRYDSGDEDDYYGMGGSSFNSNKRELDLDPSKSRLKFVSAGGEAAKQSYGIQEPARSNVKEPIKRRMLTSDERNALAAKILKAELSGKTERVKSLKEKLERGYADDDKEETSNKETSQVILMKMDEKTGLVTPATNVKGKAHEALKGKQSSSVLNAYEKSTSLQDLVNEEKQTSAQDHLNLFERALGMTAANKVDDDYVVEHKQLERTLANCQLCLERSDKLATVALGFKTYLTVVPWKGLDDFHCRIIPSEHCVSTVNLDEDVHAEMRLWRKGLVAMFEKEDEDCVFIETSKVEGGKQHMTVECIPLPRESGDLLPIYFKLSRASETLLHKKMFKLSDTRDGVRSLIPKGFSYIAVDFGNQPGYAHVIEEPEKFQSYFGQEVVAGVLDLDHKTYRNVDMESKQELKDKRDKFKERWANFDWTEEARRRLADG
ncbi:hypothetical protein M3Y97_00837600 [Aphelenchoides bicaudatus]|nr:hypothetical protein M3Y97_00837600 [Aphelenchoides bicaudatus]